MEVSRFYKFLQEEERVALNSEVRKIFPFESTSNTPKEVFAILVVLGNKIRYLHNKNTQKEITKDILEFFQDFKNSKFLNDLKS